jgi:hypothetical protein
MRQGEGADLLGGKDPRGESIGIIYVAPTDDRQSVLTAILTQDRLGRKQVAVVLPENNRAFQRPVDFDGLKSMRRGLKSEIVFVAPNGPGPAEFARQRRFPVYTSLENYASAIRAQAPEQEVRRGWFGRRQKPPTGEMRFPAGAKGTARDAEEAGAVGAMGAIGAAAAADHSVPEHDDDDEQVFLLPPTYPSTPPEQEEKEEQDERSHASHASHEPHESHADPIIGAAGAAGIVGAAAFMDHDEEKLAPPPDHAPTTDQPLSNTTENPQPDPNAGMNGAKGTSPAPRGAEPGIIAFSEKPRPRTTGKLPTASTSSSAANAPATKNANTGKRAALVAGTMAAGAGLAAASTRAPSRIVGAQGATGVPGGPGAPTASPGTGSAGPNQPRRRNRRLLALLLALLTLLLLIGIVFASPLGQQVIPHIIPGSTTTATVTITPQSKDVADNILVVAVTGKPISSLRQVQERIVSVTSPTKSASAHATGSIPGRQASGTLVFINSINNGPVTIQGGTLTGRSGVPISFSGPITIPVGSLSVTGVAVNQGTSGNIPAFDISGNCCGGNIVVKNPSAFFGGTNPQTNAVITQNDINSATNALIAQVKPEAQSQLKGQVRADEDVVPNSLNCKANVKADHAAGDVAPTVTVSGTATCSELVYDRVSAFALAKTALEAEAATNPGPGYAPVNNDIITGLIGTANVPGTQNTSLQIHAEGVWVYQFSDQLKQRLANAIANKSKSDALAFLQATTGVRAVSISISSGDTLPAANDITIIIKSVPGPSGSPTLTPSSPTPITTPTTIPTAQNGQGGS